MQNRYYQPKNAKDAMRYVQDLFNSYKDEPLTDALLQYHQKLARYIANDVVKAAKDEHNEDRAKQAASMAEDLEKWVRIRALGKPYGGKMRHFRFEPNGSHIKYKNRQPKSHQKTGTIRKSMHH